MQFGLFRKLMCDTQELEPAMSTTEIAMRNEFDELMPSQAASPEESSCHSKMTLTTKHKLFNDLVHLFEEKDWTWVVVMVTICC